MGTYFLAHRQLTSHCFLPESKKWGNCLQNLFERALCSAFTPEMSPPKLSHRGHVLTADTNMQSITIIKSLKKKVLVPSSPLIFSPLLHVYTHSYTTMTCCCYYLFYLTEKTSINYVFSLLGALKLYHLFLWVFVLSVLNCPYDFSYCKDCNFSAAEKCRASGF